MILQQWRRAALYSQLVLLRLACAGPVLQAREHARDAPQQLRAQLSNGSSVAPTKMLQGRPSSSHPVLLAVPSSEDRTRNLTNTSLQSHSSYKSDPTCINGVHPHTVWAGILTILLLVLLAILGALAVASRSDEQAEFGSGPFKGRCPHLDNAKFFLMCVVVTVHVQHATPYWRWDKQLRLFIGVFCTRTFGFISGIVSQDQPSLKSFKGLCFKLIAPLLFYIVLLEPLVLPLALGSWYTSWDEYATRIVGNITQAKAGASWYMFALIHWRIWGWMLQQLKPHWRVLLSLLAAGVAGYTMMDSFKLTQAITSFPFFVLGQLFPYRFVMERFPWRFPTALLGFALLAAMGAVAATEAGKALLVDIPYWGWSGSEIGWEPERDACGSHESALVWVRGMFRTVWELCKTLVFVIFVCPRVQLGFISELGAQTLYPFLLHYAFVELENRFFRNSLKDVDYSNATWACVWLCQFTVIFVLVTALSSWPVRKVFQPLFEPTWLERSFTNTATDQGDNASKDAIGCNGRWSQRFK